MGAIGARASKKVKGIAMSISKKKPPKKHFVEIPTDISKMSDAQIDAWAEKAYSQLAEQERENNDINKQSSISGVARESFDHDGRRIKGVGGENGRRIGDNA